MYSRNYQIIETVVYKLCNVLYTWRFAKYYSIFVMDHKYASHDYFLLATAIIAF